MSNLTRDWKLHYPANFMRFSYVLFSIFVWSFVKFQELLNIQFPSNEGKEAARFGQLWNEIITSFRDEDLINDRYYIWGFQH